MSGTRKGGVCGGSFSGGVWNSPLSLFPIGLKIPERKPWPYLRKIANNRRGMCHKEDF